MGFFSGGYHDRATYSLYPEQRDKVYGQAADYLDQQTSADPGTFWGQTYGGFQNRYQLPNPEGGLSFDYLEGGGPGMGGPGGGGFSSASAGHANAGRAFASQVDIGAEPYQTKMNETVSQGVLGRGHRLIGSQTAEANRGVETQAALTGMNPNAAAYLKHLNEQKAADSLGNAYSSFETDWVKSALNRQASARELNAQMGTNTSIANAGYSTQASIANAGEAGATSRFNAGQGNAYGEAAAGRRQRASELLLGLWDRNQNRDVERYDLLNRQRQGWITPVGHDTQDQSGLQAITGAVSGIAGAVAPFFTGPLGGAIAGGAGKLFGGGGGAGAAPYNYGGANYPISPGMQQGGYTGSPYTNAGNPYMMNY